MKTLLFFVRSNKISLLFLITVVFSISSFALNGRTTYQARIVKPNGYPLEATDVDFRFTLLDPTGSCSIYVEDYMNVNMASSGGLISFSLGSGIITFPASATSTTFQTMFDNSVPAFSCQLPGIYNPTPIDARRIVMQFNDGTGWQTLPAMTINAVPYAMYASKSTDSKRLNNKADTDFVEYSTLASLSCNSATHAITFNGASFSCIPVGSGGSDGITSVTTSGTVLVTGGTASAPVISIQAASLSQDGYLTSLDYAEFKAKLSASSTQIINTLGEQATASSTANTIVKRDSSGNISLSGLSAQTANLNYVDIYRPSTSFNIRLQAPTSLSSSYILNLPASAGTTGQVLSTDGSGNLSWINPSAGSVVSVSATAPLASTGGSNPVISITQASPTTDGYLSAADFTVFNNKLNATSAAVITALEYEPVASGSIVSSQWVSSGSTISYNDGNVGIGIASPAYRLDVNGDVRFSGSNGIYATGLNSGLWFDTSRNNGFVNYGSNKVGIRTNNTEHRLVVDSNGNIGLNVINPTARLQISAGTISNAPLKFTSGTLLSSPQSGTIEYDGNNFYVTDGTNTRRSIAATQSQGSFDNTNTISNSSGNITLAPNSSTGSVVVSATSTSSDSNTGALIVKGGAGISGNLNVSGSILTSANIQGASITATSGIITPVINGTSNLLLNPVSGNVGIGTTNPQALLHSSSSSAEQFAISNGSQKFTFDVGVGGLAADTFGIGDGTAQRFVIKNGGNVGIGTSTPTDLLVVHGASATLKIDSGFNSGTAQIKLSHTNGVADIENKVAIFAPALGAWGRSTGLYFALSNQSDSSNATINDSKLSILENGNVGIGTNNPTSKLSIDNGGVPKAVYALGLISNNGNFLPALGSGLQIGGNYSNGNSEINIVNTNSPTVYPNGGIRFSQLNSAGDGLIDHLFLSSSGNVGIGTSTPTTKLEVNSGTGNPLVLKGTASAIDRRATLQIVNTETVSNGSTSSRIGFLGQAIPTSGTQAPYWEMSTDYQRNGANNIYIYNSDKNANTKIPFFISGDSGNVGIGTITPTEKLHVDGVIKASSFITASTSYTQGVNAGDNWIRIASGLGNSYADLRIAGATSSQHGFMRLIASCNFPNGGRGDNCAINILQKSEHAETNFKGVRIVKMSTYDPYYLEVQLGNNVGADTNIFVNSVDNSGFTILNPPITGSIPVGYDSITVDTSSTLFRAGNGQLNVAGNGNVGIGTSLPVSQLHVGGSNRTLSLAGTPAPQGNASFIIMGNSDSAGVSGPTVMLSANRTTQFGVGDSFSSANGGNFTSFMTIAPTGNVGIGTTIPEVKLELQTGSIANNSYNGIGIRSDSNDFWLITKKDGSGNRRNTVYSGSGNTPLVLQEAGGNVGIGTIAPSRKLQIIDDLAPYISVGTSGNSGGHLFLGNTNHGIGRGDAANLAYTPNANDLSIYNAAGNIYLANGPNGGGDATIKMTVNPAGNVGIGTTTPGYKLDVQGGGVNSSGGYTQVSDITMKTNLQYIRSNEALEKISSLSGIYYDWKDQNQFGSDRQIGLIAQQVEKVFPEATKKNKDTGLLSVSYSNLVAPMIESIKELYRLIVENKNSIDQQNRTVASLIEKNQQIEKENQQIKEKAQQIEKENAALKAYLCAKDPGAPICK